MIAFQFLTCMDHDQRHSKMSFAAVQIKATHASARCSLVEGDKHKRASFFMLSFILYFILQLSSVFFRALLVSVFQILCLFSCLRTWQPQKVFRSSHLNGGTFHLSVFSSSSLYSPPLLSVPSLHMEPRSPHQSTEIPFFCPGCFSCSERRCRGSRTRAVQSIAYASDKVIKTQHHVAPWLCLL